MLLVTADVFSGRPNPAWIITDGREIRTTLREITQDRNVIGEAAPPAAGLGFRGVIVEPLSDDLAQDFEVPASMYIALGAGRVSARSAEIAERLIGLIPSAEAAAEAGPEALQLDESLQSFLLEQLELSSRMTAVDGVEALAEEAAAELAAVVCYYDLTAYNPGFWNNNTYVRTHNNCYNYASNKRTNTFAQPGLGCGKMYTAITCEEVMRAALCDGLHRRYDCFPSSEYPRHLVAMAVIPHPNPLYRDYHWYRKHSGGFWAHKPGRTSARDTDNSGHRIEDPIRCDRGSYTQFCGYFYTCRSQKIK